MPPVPAHSLPQNLPPNFLEYPTVIRFDNHADGAVIDNFYKGVTFESFVDTPTQMIWPVFARSSALAESPRNVVSINDVTSTSTQSPTQTAEPFFGGTLGGIRVTFTRPQLYVSIDARVVVPPESLGQGQMPVRKPFLQTFDDQGRVLNTKYGDPKSQVWQTLAFQSTSANIVSAVFSTEPASGGELKVYALFDNLVYARQLFRIILGV
jgi:hypothetical protein